MPKINLLDKSVYNQISAGEVVENPASIVKELVENSIDAGADNISVSIENGGIKSITVTDNGSGIEKDDLRLAILPHATSKIKVASDLDMVGTLGFRGEALASIAAVSEVTLKSKYAEDEIGNMLCVKGGEIVEEGACAIAEGTQIQVRSLFYNTPARYKFLKTNKGEESNITSLINELVFANPDVSFSYFVDGKTVLRTYGEGLGQCIYSVYGDAIGDNMIPLEFNENGYKISGYTARPATDAIKNNRTKQTFIINGRIIEDATISAVVQNAYGELLMKRTFPTIILDIVIPFGMVDVNVHPNKREVRFADPKKINGIIYHTVKNAVENDIAERQKTIFEEFHPHENNIEAEIAASIVNTVAEKSPLKNIKTDGRTQNIFDDRNEDDYLPGDTQRQRVVEPISIHTTFPVFNKIDIDEVAQQVTFADAARDTIYKTPTSSDEDKDNTDDDIKIIDANIKKPPYKVVGQVFDTYILVEFDKKLVFIDQHAAHERLLFDKLIEQQSNSVLVQDLLFPYEYYASAEEIKFFTDNRENFAKVGFIIEVFADRITIIGIPSLLANLDLQAFVTDLLQYRLDFLSLTDSTLVKDKIAKYACKRAIKGGAELNDKEVEYVIDYFFKNGIPLQCPHGRPTMIKLTISDIEKLFGRKV